MDNLTRRNIRYICFRLQTEADGGLEAKGDGIMSHVAAVKEHMESQADFGGWSNFARTWDVDEKAHLVVVVRTSSIHTAWNRIVEKNAKNIVEVKTATGVKRVKLSDASGIDGK